jgi:hypothetical protein
LHFILRLNCHTEQQAARKLMRCALPKLIPLQAPPLCSETEKQKRKRKQKKRKRTQNGAFCWSETAVFLLLVCPEPVLTNDRLSSIAEFHRQKQKWCSVFRFPFLVIGFGSVFLSHSCLKTNILPRQARDKHRESTQKKTDLSRHPYARGCRARRTPGLPVPPRRETPPRRRS